jgi:DNA-directed RNA polymerase specialized sigma24 family protein
MINDGRQDGHNEAVGRFLKLHGQELELQAIKLARCYNIDLHELVSRTSITVWEKWASELFVLPDKERYKCTLRILSNHARNLSRSARRNESKYDLLSGEELESLTHSITTRQDPVAVGAIFEDERFAIYKAISLLDGRCRDVMTLVALGLENSEIRQELGMTVTNLTSTKMRARKLLREILKLDARPEIFTGNSKVGDKGEGG